MIKRKKVALALSCGGWRGLTYIGIIKVLVQNKIPIDIITGSSAGALIGGLYAKFQNIYQVEEIFHKLKYRHLLLAFSDIFASAGLVKGNRGKNFIRRFLGNTQIEDLKIRFAAICTNLNTGQAEIFTKGDLVEAIRASGSVPLIFAPEIINKQKYVDGGVSIPIPVDTARQLGAEIVIAVNPYTNIFPINNNPNYKKISALTTMKIAYYSILSKLAAYEASKADLVIEPKFFEGRFDIFKKLVNHQQVITDGEKACQKCLPAIQALIKS